MAALATFTAALSAEPEMIRTTERYTVNTSSAVVRTQVTSFFSPSAMAPSRFSGRQAAAVKRPMYRYTRGSSSSRISRSSRSTKNTVDTCCTVAVVTAPVAAVAAARVGSST